MFCASDFLKNLQELEWAAVPGYGGAMPRQNSSLLLPVLLCLFFLPCSLPGQAVVKELQALLNPAPEEPGAEPAPSPSPTVTPAPTPPKAFEFEVQKKWTEKRQKELTALGEELNAAELDVENQISQLAQDVSSLSEKLVQSESLAQEQREALDLTLKEKSELAGILKQVREFLGWGKTLSQLESGLMNRVLEIFEKNSMPDLLAARKDIAAAEQDARELLVQISSKIKEFEELLTALQKQKSEKTGTPLLAVKTKALGRGIELLSNLKEANLRLLGITEHFAAQVDERIASKGIEDQISERWTNLTTTLSTVWNTSLIKTANGSLSLGNILTAAIGLLVAVVFAKILSKKTSRTLVSRFRFNVSQAHLIEKLLLYSLAIVFALMTLQWLHIPLTVFAFLGGALMVGIGFGSQNLMNNFISGLILLFEQKVHVGDLVEVDGKLGNVTGLGSRCSSLRMFDGVEVLVPNSSLLEKNVVNWTLSDPKHRYDFLVGVAYGSDLNLCMKLMQQSLDEQPELLKDPSPEVYFEEFGDSTLNFHLFYWIHVGSCDPKRVGSNIRMRIDALCRENAIEIAFPQRDVHLITKEVLRVQLEK